jgi:hypothetical protein
MYLCNCPDAVMPTTACKHMHLVQSILYPPTNGKAVISDIGNRGESTAPAPPDHESEGSTSSETNHGQEEVQTVVSSKAQDWCMRLASLMEWSKSSPVLDDSTWAAIYAKTKEIETLIRLSSVAAAVSPDLSEEAGPANKLVKRQRRF